MCLRNHLLSAAVALLTLTIPTALRAVNYALNFDGNNDFVNLGQCEAVQAVQTSTITIECWVKTGVNQRAVMVTNRHVDDGCDFPTLMMENGRAEIVMDDRMVIQRCTSNSSVNDNEWHHIAGTKDGNHYEIYVDGELDGQMDYDYDMSGSEYDLHLGHHGAWNDYHYSGLIDEVRIWDFARSGDEIAQTMNVTLGGNEEGLIGYWRLDEGEGQTTQDSGPNGYDGILGVNEDEDDQDPEWEESDAPIYGGVLWWSADSVDFGPVTRGDSPEKTLLLANIAEDDDEWHSLEFTLTDEGDGLDWLETDPTEGVIAVGDTLTVALTAINTDGLDYGFYQRTLSLESNAANIRTMEIPVSIWIVSGSGRLYGMVTDAWNAEPIEGATVMTIIGFAGYTDAEGRYDIPNLPSWTYDIYVWATDYLQYNVDDVEIAEGAEVELNFALLHAEFTADPDSFNLQMAPDEEQALPLTISNWGNGPLAWMLDLSFPEGVEREPWELRQSIAAGDTVNDNRLGGAVFVDGYFYVSGGEHDQNLVYVLDRDGAFVRHFAQLGSTVYGYADMDYDGENIWAVTGGNAYCFTTNGDSVTSFGLPFRSTQSLAWDPDSSWLWMSEITGYIYAYDRQGQQQAEIRTRNFRIYGLAYWQDDPDGHPLYIYHDLNDSMTVHKIDPARNDTMFVRFLHPERGGSPGGAFITNQLDPYSWVFIALANTSENEGGDRIDIWQLYGNTGWVGVEPMAGIVDADADAELTVTLNTAGMLAAQYQVDLAFRHDGVGGADTIPLALEVIPPDTVQPPPENHPPGEFGLLEPPDSTIFPIDYTMDSLNIDFAWQSSLDPDVGDTVWYLFRTVVGEDTLWDGGIMTSDTTITYTFRFHLSGDDKVGEHLWLVTAISPPDTVECTRLFRFFIDLYDRSSDQNQPPAHFGLTSLYPNPFNSRLLIDYGLDRSGEAVISIYDLAGREVAVLASGRQTPGRYRVTWDAAGVPSGVYLVRLTSGVRAERRKVVLVK